MRKSNLTDSMYYHKLLFPNGGGLGSGCGPVLVAIALSLLLMLISCRTKKVIQKESVQDSVRTEYIEKVVEVPVTVYVDIPSEKQERETEDTTSNLETSFARSMAALRWNDGRPILFHNLENIPQRIAKTDSVTVRERLRTVYRTRYVTKENTSTREPGLWQKLRLMADGVAIAVAILFLIYICAKVRKRPP